MAEPQVCMIFCEDTREEVGNKISLMGMLGPKITLDEAESNSGRLKGLVVGAICRFFDDKITDAEFEVQFIPASGDEKVPESPGVAKITFENQVPSEEWTTQILGAFRNLHIHVGMRIESVLRMNGRSYHASLSIEGKNS